MAPMLRWYVWDARQLLAPVGTAQLVDHGLWGVTVRVLQASCHECKVELPYLIIIGDEPAIDAKTNSPFSVKGSEGSS